MSLKSIVWQKEPVENTWQQFYEIISVGCSEK
jgi:hypothetical protein